jgi:predicted transposase YbfD/YdcC
MPHKYKWMYYKDSKVRIDRDIAPLLSKMWELGIETYNACQAMCSRSCKHTKKVKKYKDGTSLSYHTKTKHCYDRVWIAFESARALEKFLNIVSVYEKNSDGSMYDHIQGYSAHEHPHDAWASLLVLENLGIQYHEERTPIPKRWWKRNSKTYGCIVEDGCKKNNFRVAPQLWFPRKHLVYVEERLQLAIDKKIK